MKGWVAQGREIFDQDEGGNIAELEVGKDTLSLETFGPRRHVWIPEHMFEGAWDFWHEEHLPCWKVPRPNLPWTQAWKTQKAQKILQLISLSSENSFFVAGLLWPNCQRLASRWRRGWWSVSHLDLEKILAFWTRCTRACWAKAWVGRWWNKAAGGENYIWYLLFCCRPNWKGNCINVDYDLVQCYPQNSVFVCSDSDCERAH